MFATEKALVDALKLNFRSICGWNPNRSQTNVLEEVNLGFGVADLVISKVEKKYISDATFSYFDILIYKIIESDRNVSMDHLKSITKAKEYQIRKSIDMLILESYVNQHDSFFTIKKNYKSVAAKSIAIEAKLKNWKRALDQAFRYKWFATQSYVVLDSKHIRPAEHNLCSFIDLNVGLAEINIHGQLKVHFRPIETKPIDARMSMLLCEQVKQHYLVSR